MTKPDYIFETSWEVCNKVGGIYTVLSSRASTMKNYFGDNIIFVGPDIQPRPIDFIPTDNFTEFKQYLSTRKGLSVKTGRWNITGNPLVILVDFKPVFDDKNRIYGDFWEKFGVDSINAYGDYDEASMFGYAAGMVIEAFAEFYELGGKHTVAHFNEWMTAFGLLYLKAFCPNIKTVFTTHATTIGRSIAGNGKHLYEYLTLYNGDQMAQELNVEAKHSAEKTAAHLADCFTTVSNITATECRYLLDKQPDIITPNGFDNSFVATQSNYTQKRDNAKLLLKRLAEKTLGYTIDEEHLYIGISGRYEYKNKGIDVFIDVMNRLNHSQDLNKKILSFIIVPAWVKENCYSNSRFATSAIMYEDTDLTLNYIKQNNFGNNPDNNVKIIFIPTYLNGNDGALNVPYYDILIGMDMTIFPSYYEPWGYTPMESAAFGIPTITTSLAGFGQWVSDTPVGINNGIAVINRTDGNYFEVVQNITNEVVFFSQKNKDEKLIVAKQAKTITDNALWEKFFDHYLEAYDFALNR